MNFFAHGIAFLDDPYFVAGTATPDWLSVADRPVRIRARLIDRYNEAQNNSSSIAVATAEETSFINGARQHLLDDDWFHNQRAFLEISMQLGKMFREALGPDDNFRAGFLGHIVTEMLLDRVLIEQRPQLLDRYYKALAGLDYDFVQETVGKIATRTTDRLSALLPRFVQEGFLYDYLSEKKLLFRLNQVMRRVKLPLISDDFENVLARSYRIVEQRHREMLPVHVLVTLDSNPPDESI